MNILIFSGGTGSVAIQTGLRRLYNDKLDVRVITNTQDNGKSTGTVRKVLDGKINGPSDLRKNQVLRYELQGCCSDGLLKLLNCRFDCASQDAEKFCLNFIKSTSGLDELARETIVKAVQTYFAYPKALQVDYIDFSLANIIYAGLAAPNLSLIEAGKIMARNVLQIPEDSVIVSCDDPLYLQAVTKSGRIIADEGDIVDWNNPADKILDTFLVDPNGLKVTATLSGSALVAIDEADVIIFSSGTQWSSLIPTYQHYLFEEAMLNTRAKKYLVVNNIQDKDMAGVNAEEMLKVLYSYLDLKSITCIFNENAVPEMRVNESFMNSMDWDFISADISTEESKKVHDGVKLAKIIMLDYYGDKLENNNFIFDYDDTLVGRNSMYHEASKENKFLLLSLSSQTKKFFSICTGNSIKAINFNDCPFEPINLTIFAEGGVNSYLLKSESDVRTLNLSPAKVIAPEYIFAQTQIDYIISSLESIGINMFKIQNRNNAIISIKPIDPEYRTPITILLKKIFDVLTVKATGRTTIDISLGATKTVILSEIPDGKITAVGDESHEGGNDYSLSINPRVDFISVKTPRDTNVFLKTLFYHLNSVRRRLAEHAHVNTLMGIKYDQ